MESSSACTTAALGSTAEAAALARVVDFAFIVVRADGARAEPLDGDDALRGTMGSAGSGAAIGEERTTSN
jgi:hypothetical protein